MQEYGWVYDAAAENLSLDRYQVNMTTQEGNDLSAIYTKNGELVETREVSKNIPIPPDIMEKLKNSQYNDWRITGSKEIIKFYHDHSLTKSNVEHHFRINVDKNGEKRSISFNRQGSSE